MKKYINVKSVIGAVTVAGLIGATGCTTNDAKEEKAAITNNAGRLYNDKNTTALNDGYGYGYSYNYDDYDYKTGANNRAMYNKAYTGRNNSQINYNNDNDSFKNTVTNSTRNVGNGLRNGMVDAGNKISNTANKVGDSIEQGFDSVGNNTINPGRREGYNYNYNNSNYTNAVKPGQERTFDNRYSADYTVKNNNYSTINNTNRAVNRTTNHNDNL